MQEQLAKENHKFQYATIASSVRAHQYEAPINWLHAAGLVSFSHRMSEGSKPLRAYAEHDCLKPHLLDTGLLCSLQGLDEQDIAPDADKGGELPRRRGRERRVAADRGAGDRAVLLGQAGRSEVDFIVQLDDGTSVPIEVTIGTNASSRSLEAYRRAYDPPLSCAQELRI